jgi:Lrp/AsnC family transcriptional regulator for asnA, asnC and gidA
VYVIVTAGQFDLMVEVICRDAEQLLTVVNDVIRATPGVRATHLFTYLHIEKLNYSWGTG